MSTSDPFPAAATTLADGSTRRYRIWHTPGVPTAQALPVLLFLHGSGERGDDNAAQIAVGLGPALRRQAPPWPLLAVFPQLRADALWADAEAEAALQVLAAACAQFGGDATRVALTGLSRGGYGVWELALSAPTRFRALLPVCGGIEPPAHDAALRVTTLQDARDPFATAAQALRHLPCWIVHGARDTVISPQQSRAMAAALCSVGAAELHYRELAAANHNAWDAAYADAMLWRWLGHQLDALPA